MTDNVERDALEIERQRDAFRRLDRINFVERDIAVLKTRFDSAFDSFLKELARSVSEEDLKQIKRDFDVALRDAIHGVSDMLKTANIQQSQALLGQVELMLSRDREAAEREAKKTRQQFQMAMFAAVLSIMGALFVFWETQPHR